MHVELTPVSHLVCCWLQAIEWLKVHIKAAGQAPEVLPMHDPHFQNSLELAVRFGKVRMASAAAGRGRGAQGPLSPWSRMSSSALTNPDAAERLRSHSLTHLQLQHAMRTAQRIVCIADSLNFTLKL
jgi:hypothetical protein